LSDVCGVDLSKAFLDKVSKNKAKYPKDLVKGSSKKYSEYKNKAT
jgi:dCTP diphosphatase